jgi:hypothetical protein
LLSETPLAVGLSFEAGYGRGRPHLSLGAAMPTIFWLALGGLALSIFNFYIGDIAAGIGLLITIGLGCALYEKLEQWGIVKTRYKIKTQKSEPRAAGIDHVISDHLREQEELRKPTPPPPNPAPNPASPLKGLMRVDVTQTINSVDVYILLSEQARFLINTHNLGAIPIEENFEDLRAHMAEFKRQLSTAFDETDANIMSEFQGDDREYTKRLVAEWQSEDKALLPEQLRAEEERYRKRNTVYLSDYLQYPYRKVIANPVEAAAYIKRLEQEYLPRIKATIDGASPQTTKTYEF